MTAVTESPRRALAAALASLAGALPAQEAFNRSILAPAQVESRRADALAAAIDRAQSAVVHVDVEPFLRTRRITSAMMIWL